MSPSCLAAQGEPQQRRCPCCLPARAARSHLSPSGSESLPAMSLGSCYSQFYLGKCLPVHLQFAIRQHVLKAQAEPKNTSEPAAPLNPQGQAQGGTADAQHELNPTAAPSERLAMGLLGGCCHCRCCCPGGQQLAFKALTLQPLLQPRSSSSPLRCGIP